MNLVELDTALRKLRLSGMAATLDARLRQAQSERQAPIDLISALVGDELMRRQDRLIARRVQPLRPPLAGEVVVVPVVGDAEQLERRVGHLPQILVQQQGGRVAGIDVTLHERRRTMLAALAQLASRGSGQAVCIATHAVFAAQAYEDTSLPIGHGQTISKPSVVGRMMELLFGGATARGIVRGQFRQQRTQHRAPGNQIDGDILKHAPRMPDLGASFTRLRAAADAG